MRVVCQHNQDSKRQLSNQLWTRQKAPLQKQPYRVTQG